MKFSSLVLLPLLVESVPILDLKKDWVVDTNNDGDRFLKAAIAKNDGLQNIEAYLVIEDGVIVSEYYSPDAGVNTLFQGWSLTKSVVGLMLGRMYHDGLFKMDDDLEKIIPGNFQFPNKGQGGDTSFGKKWEENPDFAHITMSELLTMTSGMKGFPSTSSTIDCVFNSNCGSHGDDVVIPLDLDYKGYFHYVPANNILSYVMEKLAADPAAYAKNNFFPDLGIKSFAWWKTSCGDGCPWAPMSTALHGAMLKVRDLAKIAQYSMQDGASGPGKESKLPSWWKDTQVPCWLDGFCSAEKRTMYHAGFWYSEGEDLNYGQFAGAGGKNVYMERENTAFGKSRIYVVMSLQAFHDGAKWGQECKSEDTLGRDFCDEYTVDGASFDGEFLEWHDATEQKDTSALFHKLAQKLDFGPEGNHNLARNGELCEIDSECNSGRCEWKSYTDSTTICMARDGRSELCNEHDDCLSGSCITGGGECVTPAWCCEGVTASLEKGEVCYVNKECKSGRCDCQSTLCTQSICYGEDANGVGCNEHSDCASGYCSNRFLCSNKSNGSPCLVDGDCNSGRCTWNHICEAKLPSGTYCGYAHMNDGDCASGECTCMWSGWTCQFNCE